MQCSSIGLTALCRASVVAVLAASTSSQAIATPADLYDRYFSNVLAGQPCFARAYGQTLLNAHPAQRLRSIEIVLAKTNSDGSPNSSDRFELGFALMPAANGQWYRQAASCKASDTAFDCYLEGDGGIFRLTPEADGSLRLNIGEEGISIEGDSDTLEISGTEGADRVFTLLPSKDECDTARTNIEDERE